MPKIRNVLRHLSVEKAVGKRTCHANTKHIIMPDEVHLAVQANQGRENICLACAPGVLKVARNHFEQLVAELFPGGLPKA